jgi:hypothetical protein
MIAAMSDENFEDALRAIAQNVSDSLKRLAGEDFDLDEAVRATGLDPEEAKRRAREWFSAHAPSAPAGPSDPLRDAAPHPLDVPTEEQGVALAALDSGRWTVEPGTEALLAHGPGPAPDDALGLVRELRVRDWLGADGRLTLAGRRALERWLDR